MRASVSHDRSELRGTETLPAMIFASAIVIIAVAGIALHQHWWVVGIAVAVEVALILGGLMWIMPVVSDGETPDTSEPAGSQATVTELAARGTDDEDPGSDDHAPGHTSDQAPHVSA